MTQSIETRIRAARAGVTLAERNFRKAKSAKTQAKRDVEKLLSEKRKAIRAIQKAAQRKREAVRKAAQRKREAEANKKQKSVHAVCLAPFANKLAGHVHLPVSGRPSKTKPTIGFKTVDIYSANSNGYRIGQAVLVLSIPTSAHIIRCKRNGKARASEAEVIGVCYNGHLVDKTSRLQSGHDRTYTYKVGNTQYPKMPFSFDRYQECASGIHFWATLAEAKKWGGI